MILLASGVVVLAALLVVSQMMAESLRKDAALVSHTLDVENRLSLVMSRLQDAETGQRGYLLTRRAEFLPPYEKAMASIDGELVGLERAVADNPAQQAAAVRLHRIADERLHSLRLALIGGAPAGSYDIGRRLMDRARQEVDHMRAEEQRLLMMRRERSQESYRRLRAALFVGFGLALALTVFAVCDAVRRLNVVTAGREALEKANADLTSEAAAREEVEARLRQMQKLEAVGQLTGGVAHDFNNMLSIIIGSLELARRRASADLAHSQQAIDNALEGARRAAGLTARLLAFSRQQPLAPLPLDPNKLVLAMSEMLRRTLGERVEIETVLSGGCWRIHADPSELENALVNLAVNGRDAMPDGGRLTVETSNAFLDETYARHHPEVQAGQFVLISVTDTGAGMSPEVAARAFDPFYTTKTVGKGTGLGLSQVYGFVKQSGGHVKIYSEIGRGTSVKIYLPRWTGEAASDAPPPPAPLPVAGATEGETVLVVEDDEAVRMVAVESLRQLGYRVFHAEGGEAALALMDHLERLDLIFTDVVMPGLTGKALADAAVERRPGVKVLYTTGYTRNAVVHNGMLDSGIAFLPKPFTVDQLAAKVRSVLDGRGVNRPL